MNSSKLAQPGESRTTSPGDAISPAAPNGLLEARRKSCCDCAADATVDLLARLTEQHHRPDPLADEGDQRFEISFLVATAEEEDDGIGEALKRPHDGPDVGSLGIVIEADAPFLADVFDPVGDAAEALHRAG